MTNAFGIACSRTLLRVHRLSRAFSGTVISHDVFVVLDVMWLARVLKPILDHRGITKNKKGKRVRKGGAVVVVVATILWQPHPSQQVTLDADNPHTHTWYTSIQQPYHVECSNTSRVYVASITWRLRAGEAQRWSGVVVSCHSSVILRSVRCGR